MGESRVFVTGATGLIGAAVARAAQRRGWIVLGLARSQEAERRLRGADIISVRGDLGTLETLTRAAAEADAVAHTAFQHGDGSRFDEAIALERSAISALLAGAGGRPFAYTSGTMVLGDTGDAPADEDRPLKPPPFIAWRAEVEAQVLEAAGTVLRPGLVFGHAGSGVVNGLIAMARARGHGFYIGDGENRWSATHVDDVGEAYALAIERRAGARVFHLGAEDVRMRVLGEAIGRLIGRPDATQSIPLDVARATVPFADGIVMNQRVDSGRARRELGWAPAGPELLHDLEFGSYRSALAPEVA